MYKKEKQINDLSPEEIGEILYLAGQSNGRRRLITNLYSISESVLAKILYKYATGRIIEAAQPDYS